MFLRHNIFTLFFLSLILVGCLLPGGILPKVNTEHLDKVIHISLFFLFSFSAILGLIKQNQFPRLHFDAVKYVIGFSISLTIITEVIQHLFIPRRSFDLFDILADLIGIIIAFAFFMVVRGDNKCGF